MYRCESWTIKKAERQRFRTVVLEKTPKRPLESKEMKPVNPNGNQAWIFIGRIDAEAPMLWPPDWCKDPTHWKRHWWLGKTEGRRKGGQQSRRWLDGIINSMHMSLSRILEMVNDRESWRAAVLAKNQTWLNLWKTAILLELLKLVDSPV